MPDTLKTNISLPQSLFTQVEILAQELNISPNALIETAIARFIQNQQAAPSESATLNENARSIINQGDIHWVQMTSPDGLEPGIPHPHVVVQANLFNHSRVETVVICALTTNLKRASLPGNVVLEAGEANLAKASVVEVSKVSSLPKIQLGEYIGTLSEHRVNQILAGMRFLQSSYFPK